MGKTIRTYLIVGKNIKYLILNYIVQGKSLRKALIGVNFSSSRFFAWIDEDEELRTLYVFSVNERKHTLNCFIFFELCSVRIELK